MNYRIVNQGTTDDHKWLQVEWRGDWDTVVSYYNGLDNWGNAASDVTSVEATETRRNGGDVEITYSTGKVIPSFYGKSQNVTARGVMDNRHRSWRRRSR